MIIFDSVSKTYEDGALGLKNVSIHIKKGDFAFVTGASGSGKSTFLRLLLKETEPDSGKIYIDGNDITALKPSRIPYLRRKLGVVFQDFRLLPSKTVYDNVAFALIITQTPKNEIKDRVPEVLDLVGLSHKHLSMPDQLSGGERQRVAIARAIVNRPPILLADEPTGNLDPDMAWEITELMEKINKKGTTVVAATHAREIVDKLQKRVITINKGRIVRDVECGGYGDD